MPVRYRPHGLRGDVIKKKKIVREYKMSKGCSVCGYNEASEALDLDHIDRADKEFNLAKAHLYSYDRIQKELAKCVVLCANCHRIKTLEERDNYSVEAKKELEETESRQSDLFGEKT